MANPEQPTSAGLFEGLSREAKAGLEKTVKYDEKVKAEPAKIKEAWSRIVCSDPDGLDSTDFTFGADDVTSFLAANAVRQDDTGEAAVALRAFPLRSLLKKATKNTWKEITKDKDTINSFILGRVNSSNEHVTYVRDMLMEMWSLIQDVMIPRDNVDSRAIHGPMNAQWCAACSTFHRFVLSKINELHKGPENWKKEAFAKMIVPCALAPVPRDRSRSPRGPGLTVTDGPKDEKKEKVKAADKERQGKRLLSAFKEAELKEPVDSADIQKVITKLINDNPKDAAAIKVACSVYCKNCLMDGRLKEHTLRQCYESGRVDWHLKCQKCSKAHPTWKH